MKMNANGGKGSHGRSRSMKEGVLKNDVFKEYRTAEPSARYKRMSLIYGTTWNKHTSISF